MRPSHPDIRIRSLAQLTSHHEGEDARQIRLVRQSQQVEEYPDVVFELVRHAHRGIGDFQRRVGLPLSPLNPSFDFADVVDVFTKAYAIARSNTSTEVG